jgi:hypothetical protein
LEGTGKKKSKLLVSVYSSSGTRTCMQVIVNFSEK